MQEVVRNEADQIVGKEGLPIGMVAARKYAAVIAVAGRAGTASAEFRAAMEG